MARKSLQIGINDDIYRPLVEQVFDYWKDVLDHPRSRMDAVKFRILVTQFELGYELEDLQIAIEGVASDPWEGRRDHDGLDVIFRSGNIDKFIKLGEQSRQWRERQIEKRQAMQQQQEQAKAGPSKMSEETKAMLSRFKKTLTATR